MFCGLLGLLGSITACDPQLLEQLTKEDEEVAEDTERFAESDATSDRRAAAFEDLAGQTLFMFRAPEGLLTDPLNRCSHLVEEVEFSEDYMQCARRLFGTGFYGDLDHCAGLDPRKLEPVPVVAEEHCTIECNRSEDADHTYEDCHKVCVKAQPGQEAENQDHGLPHYQFCLEDCKNVFPRGPENDPQAGLCFKRCEELLAHVILPAQVGGTCEEQCKASTDPTQLEMCLQRCHTEGVPPTPALPWQEECVRQCKTEYATDTDPANVERCLASCGAAAPTNNLAPLDQCRFECKEKLAHSNDPLEVERCLASCSDNTSNLPPPIPAPASCTERCKQENGNDVDPARLETCLGTCTATSPEPQQVGSPGEDCAASCSIEFKDQGKAALEQCRQTRCTPAAGPANEDPCLVRCHEKKLEGGDGYEACLRECLPTPEPLVVDNLDNLCPQQCGQEAGTNEEGKVLECLRHCPGFLPPAEEQCKMGCSILSDSEALDRCYQQCAGNAAPALECELRCAETDADPERFAACRRECSGPADRGVYCELSCRQALLDDRPIVHQQCTELCLRGEILTTEAEDIDVNLRQHKECLLSCEKQNEDENWVADELRLCLKRCGVENLSFANSEIPETRREEVFQGCLKGVLLLMQVCGEYAPRIDENPELSQCLNVQYGSVRAP
ncbi:MAG: hypothetical protein A2284_00145 [Deltaproteobacteria bacterium RIFOXYA12_FULL_61_11]|nr:MAG: hypothetical protein A2284_00145 [Deltaproteobacteria bacterium RIFOXYA12_FULL_61_11]